MDIKLPKGTHDIIGAEAEAFESIETMLKNVVRNYGYLPIRTPIFEHTELFTRSVGDSSDIVRKEMYTFDDKAQRSLTLRPELTAGVMRAIVENKLDATAALPIKLFYTGPAFRYDRPQLGRFRQFYQFGVENVGIAHPYQVAETISLGYEALRYLGFESMTLKINSLGDGPSRDQYKEALKGFYKNQLSAMCPDCQARYQTNPLRILDCKVPTDIAINEKAPKISKFLSPNAQRHFNQVLAALKLQKIPFELDDNLVRGLDYYADVVFEFNYKSPSGKSYGAIGGGGQYNHLVRELGGQPLAGVGFAFGEERIFSVMTEAGLLDDHLPHIDAVVMPLDEKQDEFAFTILQNLRRETIASESTFDHKPLKNQFKFAEKRGAIVALIIGDQEVKDQQVTLKNLNTQEQQKVAIGDLLSAVEKVLEQEGHHHSSGGGDGCGCDGDCN